jgi:FlaA1/EpsC-like NDP-sugar epimerase
MSRELVIVGNGQMAELFCSQFTHNTDYRVVGFSIGRELMTGDELLGLPLVPLEELRTQFPPRVDRGFHRRWPGEEQRRARGPVR